MAAGEPEILKLSPKDFLEKVPPGTWKNVHATPVNYANGGPHMRVSLNITIQLDCEVCDGTQNFEYPGQFDFRSIEQVSTYWADYTCRNCKVQRKIFGLVGRFFGDCAQLYKIGEFPSFGPPTPTRLQTLFGGEAWDFFLKGRRCENQGLGIAAYAYYRRVIDDRRAAIFDQLIRAARSLGATPNIITQLEEAKTESRFKSAMQALNAALPDILNVGGQNVLGLLYGHASEGLHNCNDDWCLAQATALRLVLHEMAERVTQALQDKVALEDAVKRLSVRGPR